MHAAPPVRMSLVADPCWHAFITACTSAAAANLTAWAASQALQSPTVSGVPVLASAMVAGSLVWALLRRGNAGDSVVTWDGAARRWAPGNVQPTRSEPVVGDLRVTIDLGPWILLRFVAAAPLRLVRWLPVSRRQAGASWPAWRAALFSRHASPDPITAIDAP
jgi:hypothetical protein